MVSALFPLRSCLREEGFYFVSFSFLLSIPTLPVCTPFLISLLPVYEQTNEHDSGDLGGLPTKHPIIVVYLDAIVMHMI